MVMIYKELKNYNATIVAQIHDELIIDCHKKDAKEVKKIVEKCMINAGIGLCVPMKITCKIGKSWYEIH